MCESQLLHVLDGELQKLLRSQVTIQSLPQAIKECLENSIDAEATEIHCRVDVTNLSFVIEDDGTGIFPDNLETVGDRFCTSKLTQLKDLESIRTYGFRGEALNSLSAISNLRIISKVRHYDCPFEMRLSRGKKTLSRARRIENDEELHHAHFGRLASNLIKNSGTIIAAAGVFGNLPVRQKSLQSIPRLKVLDDIRKCVYNASVVKPTLTFKVSHITNGAATVIINLIGLKCQQENLMLSSVFKSIYGSSVCGSFDSLSATQDNFRLWGVMGNYSVPTTGFQDIFFNNRILSKSLFSKEINRWFQSTDFGIQSELAPDSQTSRFSQQSGIIYKGKSYSKYPIFVIKIAGPVTISDLLQDPSKKIISLSNFETIKFLIFEALGKYLKEHGIHSTIGRLSYFSKSNNTFVSNTGADSDRKSFRGPSGNLNRQSAKLLLNSSMKVDKVNSTEIAGRGIFSSKQSHSYNKSMLQQINVNGESGKNSDATKRIPNLEFTRNIEKIDLPYLSRTITSAKSKSNLKVSDHFEKFNKIKLNKSSFDTFKVISQLDNKFILLKGRMKSEEKLNTVLLILDQHACDERVRVEKNFKSFIDDVIFNLNNSYKYLGEELPETIDVPLTEREIELILDVKKNFELWGITFVQNLQNSLSVSHAPKLLQEKLTKRNQTNVKVMKKLLLQHSYAISEKRKLQAFELLANESEIHWWKWMALMPDLFIELINSKSCRSAIMFGDTLTLEECEKLVGNLSQCKFAFQCAHGRPSVIPIADLSHLQ